MVAFLWHGRPCLCGIQPCTDRDVRATRMTLMNCQGEGPSPHKRRSIRMLDQEQLKGLLSHPDQYVRIEAAEHLARGLSRDPSVVPLVLDAMEGMKPHHKRHMFYECRDLAGGEAAFDRLLSMLDTEDADIRPRVADLIARSPIAVLKA